MVRRDRLPLLRAVALLGALYVRLYPLRRSIVRGRRPSFGGVLVFHWMGSRMARLGDRVGNRGNKKIGIGK